MCIQNEPNRPITLPAPEADAQSRRLPAPGRTKPMSPTEDEKVAGQSSILRGTAIQRLVGDQIVAARRETAERLAEQGRLATRD